MYSGGIDSTCIYLSLKGNIRNSRIIPATVNLPQATNSVERARSVGRIFNINPRVVDFSWPPKKKSTTDILSKKMRYDIINQNNPHWPIFEAFDNTTIISGQNMDTILTGGMITMQSYGIIDILTNGKKLKKWFRKTLKNIMYTNKYEHSMMAKLLYRVILAVYISKEYKTVEGSIGHYLGLVSTATPNKVLRETVSFIEDETERVLQLIGYQTQNKTSYLKYVQHQHNAAKLLSTFCVNGSSVELPAMWQPLNKYGLDKRKTLKEAAEPKRELNNYIKNMTGVNFRHDIGDKLSSADKSIESSDSKKFRRRSPLVADHINLLRVSTNKLCEYCNQPELLSDRMTYLYNNKDNLNLKETETALKLINLESIIRNST